MQQQLEKIVKSRNTSRLPLLFDEFYIIIIYYFRSAELDDILEEESDDDNSSASPPVISSPSSNSPDGSFRLPGSSSRHRNQQVNTESTSSASSTDGRVGTPPLTSRSKGPSSRSSGRVSFTILISKLTYLGFNWYNVFYRIFSITNSYGIRDRFSYNNMYVFSG